MWITLGCSLVSLSLLPLPGWAWGFGLGLYVVELLDGLFVGLDWFVYPLPGMWVCIGLMPLSYIYRGGAVRFSFALVSVCIMYLYCLFGHCPFW